MKRFEIVREVTLSPQEAWDRITDWEAHGAYVPFTRISRTSDGFVARTGLGPVGFDDPMEIVEWDPPRRCRLVKRGRVVTGDAEIVVEPTSTGARVIWREGTDVIGVPAFADPLVARSGERLFGRVIDGVLGT